MKNCTAVGCLLGACNFLNSYCHNTTNKFNVEFGKMQREIYQQEDEIDMQRDKLQEKIRQKLNGITEITHIMTIAFEVV